MVTAECARERTATPRKTVTAFALCAVSVAMACTCVSVLLVQWTQIKMLRVELLELKQRIDSFGGREEGSEGTACCGVWDDHRHSLRQRQSENRGRREVSGGQGKRRQKRQTGQRTFLYLQPVSSQSYDEKDSTMVTWALGRSQGQGLQVTGETVTVVTEGTYFVYGQVLFRSTSIVMGYVIKKRLHGTEMRLMKCLTSMPSNASLGLNSCYTAGVHFLESGSVLELSVPRKSAELILTAHATFLGIFSI